MDQVDIVIIGAGPIGLAAAARLASLDCTFIVLEKGQTVANNMLEWGHVQLFTNWEESIDPVSLQLINQSNVDLVLPGACPSGHTLASQFLIPLSTTDGIKHNLKLNTEVVKIASIQVDGKIIFEIEYLENNKSQNIQTKFVIDASGTWGNFNQITKPDSTADIQYGIPSIEFIKSNIQDVNVAIIGNGHSAMNTILAISKYSNSKVDWVIRGEKPKFGLSQVGGRSNSLEQEISKLIISGAVSLKTTFEILEIEQLANQYILKSNNKQVGPYGHIIANTGASPYYGFLSNIEIALDKKFLTANKLSKRIDPSLHSCDTVSYSFKDTIVTDKNYFVVGMKSFGRASNFLLSSGYQILDELIDHLLEELL